jgi:hypothetical protein
VGVLGREAEVQIEPGERDLELADRLGISTVRDRVCMARGSFGSRRAEGLPPTLSVNLYNQKSHVRSAAMCAMSESR